MRVVRRMVGRMVAESSCTTQQQTAVTRHGRHIMVVILVHSPVVILWIMWMPWIRWILVDLARMLAVPEGSGEVPHGHGRDIFFQFVVSQCPLKVFLHFGRGVPSIMSEDHTVCVQVLRSAFAIVRVLRSGASTYGVRRSIVV